MAKSRKEDRVKEGRSRITLVLDDELVSALNVLAKHDEISRAKVIGILLERSLYSCGYNEIIREYPEAFEYWKQIWDTRPKGFFENEDSSPFVSDTEMQNMNSSPDEDEKERLENLLSTQNEIHDQYSKLWDKIEEDKRKAQEEFERKYNSIKGGNKQGGTHGK